MNFKRLLLLCSLTAALAAGLTLYPVAPREPSSEAVVAPARVILQRETVADLSALQRELLALRRELEQLRVHVSMLQQPHGAAEPGTRATAELGTPAEQRKDAEQRRLEYIGSLEAAFVREASDAGWSAQLRGELESELAAATIQSIECRSRTCRAELRISENDTPSAAALGSLSRRFAEQLPNLVVHRDTDANGHGTMVLYLARGE